MKFSQMEYQRPDVDGMIEQYKQITERFPNCKNAKEQMKCILEHESIMKAYQTMSTLAYIHNSINTADEFYAQEKAFYNEKSPVIQEYEQAFLQVVYDSRFRKELEKEVGILFFENIKVALRSFSPEIIPLLQQENELTTEYQKLLASAKIEFDGKTVVNRTPAEIMNLLCLVDAKLEEDVRRQQSACENEDLVFDGLSEIMKQRIFLVQSIGQHPEIGGFSRDALDYEIARCAMAENLGRLGKGYLEKFRTLSLQSQQAVLMGDIDKELIEDIIPLAEAFAQDLATGVEDPRHSEVMKTWSCIFDFSPENFERFREHYFKRLSEKKE